LSFSQVRVAFAAVATALHCERSSEKTYRSETCHAFDTEWPNSAGQQMWGGVYF